MKCYLAKAEQFATNEVINVTPFTALSDEAAIAAGRESRDVTANAYFRGFRDAVRVRVWSMELGEWDGSSFATTTSSEPILDTAEEMWSGPQFTLRLVH